MATPDDDCPFDADKDAPPMAFRIAQLLAENTRLRGGVESLAVGMEKVVREARRRAERREAEGGYTHAAVLGYVDALASTAASLRSLLPASDKPDTRQLAEKVK